MLDLWGSDVPAPGAPPLFSKPARVAVFGSRAWPLSGPAAALLLSFVASLPAGSVVLSGGQRGADALASSAAFRAGLSVVSFPAPFAAVGASAGPRRSAVALRSLGPVGCGCAACAPVVASVPASAWLGLRGGAAFVCPGPVCPLCVPAVPAVPVSACVVFSALGAGSPGSVAAVAAARRAGVPCWSCSPAGVWARC